MAAIKVESEKRLVLVSGRAHPALADQVAYELGTELVRHGAADPSRTARSTRATTNRSAAPDVFIIQSHTSPINEWLMESLIMIDAAKRASAKRITIVAPFYPYARQDKKGRGREPISARLIADLFTAAGGKSHHVGRPPTPRRSRATSTVRSTISSRCRCCSSTSAGSRARSSRSCSPDMGRVRVADVWSDRLGAAARDHPQAPRPARGESGLRSTRSSARSRAGSA